MRGRASKVLYNIAGALTGSAILALERGFQSQFSYCWWYRSSHGADFVASPARIQTQLCSRQPPRTAELAGSSVSHGQTHYSRLIWQSGAPI